jgi:hypothetical protein
VTAFAPQAVVSSLSEFHPLFTPNESKFSNVQEGQPSDVLFPLPIYRFNLHSSNIQKLRDMSTILPPSHDTSDPTTGDHATPSKPTAQAIMKVATTTKFQVNYLGSPPKPIRFDIPSGVLRQLNLAIGDLSEYIANNSTENAALLTAVETLATSMRDIELLNTSTFYLFPSCQSSFD